MNIIVKPYGSELCYCRPDTTWERENRDFYSPECVNEVLWTPVVFARVSKAGKCIGRKFASRYYDGVGCGMLMYCKLKLQETSGDPRLRVAQAPPSRGWHVTSCHPAISVNADHTSILPMPLYNPAVLEEEKVFEVSRNGVQVAVLSSNAATDLMSTDVNADVMSTERSEWRHLLEEALCNASQLTSLRIGDFVAVELAPVAVLAAREDADVSIKGTFCENEIFNFRMHL